MIRGRPENLQARPRPRVDAPSLRETVRNGELFASLVKAADIVFFARLRCASPHSRTEPRLAKEVMVDATFDLLELCVKHNIEKVVAASSRRSTAWLRDFPTTERQNRTTTAVSTAPRKPSTKGCCASYDDMHGLRLRRSSATSTSTAIRWTSTAVTPKF